jgi:hypothetical protein
MTRSFARLGGTIAAATLALSLAACGGGGDSATKTGDAAGSTSGAAGETAAPALDPILANPAVGDLYSGELTHFSAADFEGMETAYGMMRVVAVSPTTVTVITETGAYPEQGPATAELNSGSLDNVTWDETERLDINRADLARLLSEGKIAAFRRP